MTSTTPHTQQDTAVLFIIFNRPETTQQVFNAIRKARPLRLYIAADGPRKDRPNDLLNCELTKQIVSNVDWECEVQTLFSEENLGCGKGPCTAINWFFEHESEGIILEDDCLPSPTFFRFCSELLKYYRDDTRVMEIGGNNFEPGSARDKEYSYGFSNLIYIWGWATWRRAWKFHDFHMKHYMEIHSKRYLDASFSSIYERDFYQYVFSKMHKGDLRTSSRTIWDYQWQFACKIHSGLIIVPNQNLVVNLGFGSHATNTLNPRGVGHNLILEDMEFPLRYPEFMIVDKGRENKVFRAISTSISSRLRSRIKNLIPNQIIDKIVRPIIYSFNGR